MFVLRWIGTLFILFALVAVADDGTKSLEVDKVVMTPLGQHWSNLNRPSLNTAQVVVERYVFKPLWDYAIFPLLLQPTWAVFGVIGVFLFWLGRRRPEKPDPFIN